MKLIKDWREVLNKAWSVKTAIFTALLGVADQILYAFMESVPPVVYSVLMVLVVVVRVLEQSNTKVETKL